MSYVNPVTHKWPVNWLFPADQVPSNGSALSDRQKLAKLISDIGAKLNVSHQCINTAIAYMHRFLMVHSPTRYYLPRVCQASIFLACKSEESIRLVVDVDKCTANVLKIQSSGLSEVINFHRRAILDYEDVLVRTLGFGVAVHHPYEYIIETITKIGDQTRSLTTKLLDELTKIAYYVAKQSILLTPFCVKYSAELIAYFCIQLSIEIKNNGLIKSTGWIKRPFTAKLVHNIIYEFYTIYMECRDNYKQNFANEEEYNLYQILHKKSSSYVKSISSALISRTSFDSSSVSDTDEQETLAVVRLSSTTDSCRHTESATLPTNQSLREPDIDSSPIKVDINPSNKRRYDSSNDDKSCKRSSSQQRE